MASLSASIMAHPKRAHLIPRLTERLGLSADDVAWDRRSERWDTGRRAWEMYDPTADYHLVIQDDAVVAADLIPGLEKALDHVPAEANVCPFIGTRRPAQRVVQQLIRTAERKKASWIEFPSLFWGVAIIVPTPVIGDMLAFGDSITAYPNYDKRIGQFFVQRLHWPTYCTWPNLVDHRDDLESLCGHGAGRVAHRFAGEQASALDVDWGGTVAKYGGLPPSRRIRGRKPGAAKPVPLAAYRTTPKPVAPPEPQARRYYRRGKRVPFADFPGIEAQ